MNQPILMEQLTSTLHKESLHCSKSLKTLATMYRRLLKRMMKESMSLNTQQGNWPSKKCSPQINLTIPEVTRLLNLCLKLESLVNLSLVISTLDFSTVEENRIICLSTTQQVLSQAEEALRNILLASAAMDKTSLNTRISPPSLQNAL